MVPFSIMPSSRAGCLLRRDVVARQPYEVLPSSLPKSPLSRIFLSSNS
jgi:hypothetical protein